MKQIVSGSQSQCQSPNPSCWRKNLGTAPHKRIKLEEQSDRGRGEQSPSTGEDPYDGAVKLNGCILSHRTPPLGTYRRIDATRPCKHLISRPDVCTTEKDAWKLHMEARVLTGPGAR